MQQEAVAIKMEAAHLTRSKIVAVARSWIGTPYHNRAAIKGVGADCLGVLRGVYSELYQIEPEKPPHYNANWSDINREELLLQKAQQYLEPASDIDCGNVLIFRMNPSRAAKHCGIVTTAGLMVHALSGHKVEEVHISSRYLPRIVSIFKFPGVK